MSTLARRAVVVALIGASTLALAACEKPSPGVSVVSGTSSAHREALCWSFSGDPLSPEACADDVVAAATEGGTLAQIPVIPGNTIGISVDTKVANAGWYPVVGSQRLTQQPLHSTYYRFTYPDLQPVPEAGVALEVVAGQDDSTVGLWAFQLVPDPGVE